MFDQKQKFHAVFMASPSPLLIMLPDHPQFTITDVNKAYLDMTHCREGDLVGKSLFTAFPEDDTVPDSKENLKKLKKGLERLVIDKQPHVLELQRYDIPIRGTAKFERRYWGGYNNPVLNEKGDIEFIVHQPIDLTPQVLAEQKSQSVEEQLRKEALIRESIQKQLSREKDFAESVIKSLPGTFYLIDSEGRFRKWNKNLEDLTGYKPEEVKHMHAVDFVPEEEKEMIVKTIQKVLDEGRGEAEASLLRKNGNTIPFYLHAISVQLGGECFILGIGLDITERVQIEAQVKASLREKEILLNEIHHRVKNNLAIVSSLLHLHSETITDRGVKSILAESEGRIHSMALIHELLYKQKDFSSIEFGAYIDELLMYISANSTISSIPVVGEVRGDQVHIKINTAVPCALLCHELITNAYKHAFVGRESGRITISLKKDEDTVTLTVIDNGIGFDPHIERSTLGLSLVHGLAGQIGGTVSINTENGTAFTVKFPASRAVKHHPLIDHQS